VILAAVTVSALKDMPSGSTTITQTSFMTATITSRLLSIFPSRSISIMGRDTGPLHAQNIKAPIEDESVRVRIFGKPVDESFDGEVLQEFIERTGRLPGFAEKSMMHGCGDVLDASCHYKSASR
jgi:hypothetical protein